MPETPREFSESLANLGNIQMVRKIIGAEDFDLTKNNSWDGDHYDTIGDILRMAGWVGCGSVSHCTIATRERNLVSPDGELTINIIVANFMGTFTAITVGET